MVYHAEEPPGLVGVGNAGYAHALVAWPMLAERPGALAEFNEALSAVTDIHTGNATTLLNSALASGDPSRMAQFLAEAQRQLGWAQRRVIDESQHQKLSWRRIGALVGIAHDALYHQYASGGPVVTVSPFYRRESAT